MKHDTVPATKKTHGYVRGSYIFDHAPGNETRPDDCRLQDHLMSLVLDYRDARRSESVSRLRRVIALRAMLASGKSQREVAASVGLSQPAVSRQLRFAPDLQQFDPATMFEAAAPVLKTLAADRVIRD